MKIESLAKTGKQKSDLEVYTTILNIVLEEFDGVDDFAPNPNKNKFENIWSLMEIKFINKG